MREKKLSTELYYTNYPTYCGNDLGLTYTLVASNFKVWAPSASQIKLNLYSATIADELERTLYLSQSHEGVWEITINEDLIGRYYTFQAEVLGKWKAEVPDPYVKAVGTNGQRGHIINFDKTNPINWENDTRPHLEKFTDIIIYELHVRDLSIHEDSGIQHKGQFLGLTELNTQNAEGLSTGLDHIKSLGVTHVHLLPSYDFFTIDESRPQDNQYNWGYDPQNYNVPEGSYATNPEDGAVRIREFKRLVQALHQNGLRVIMDVVYNHTGRTEASNFNQLVPGYYYRQDAKGNFSDASSCGNETASERPMMRKFMIDSVKYWAEEYHIDGFRFDLMGIHDMETMNQITEALYEIDPTIFVYGEGWTGGDSPLPEAQRAVKKQVNQMKRVAAFSDDMRDAIKGQVFSHEDTGFVSGKKGIEESIKFGIVAATSHPQIDYGKVNYSNAPWAKHPSQTINYASCHDNHTLWDRLLNSQPNISEADRIRMHILANTIVLTSQGIPFLHAGVEILRTKDGVENSYKSPDSINQIDWSRKSKYPEVVKYHQQLIKLRKKHPAFRMPTAQMIQENLSFLDVRESGVVAYLLKGEASGDTWKEILVLFNGSQEVKKVAIPKGNWTVALDGNSISEEGLYKISEPEIVVDYSSAMLLFRKCPD